MKKLAILLSLVVAGCAGANRIAVEPGQIKNYLNNITPSGCVFKNHQYECTDKDLQAHLRQNAPSYREMLERTRNGVNPYTVLVDLVVMHGCAIEVGGLDCKYQIAPYNAEELKLSLVDSGIRYKYRKN